MREDFLQTVRDDSAVMETFHCSGLAGLLW